MVFLIDKYRKELVDLCRKYYVKKLEVFGSAATGEFGQFSDIDFLVEFDSEVSPRRFDNFFEFQRALEQLFDRRIDLIEPAGLSNPYFIRQVNQTRRQIYASA